MPLVKRGKVVADDFMRVADGEPLPDAPVIVSAERLLAEAANLFARGTPVGVIWPNNRRVSELAPLLDKLALVALVFPVFKDGRAYSQARQLREQYGFRGELRASGAVLRDQLLFMQRAGFDAFEVKKEADAGAFFEATHRFSAFYQPAADGRPTILRERLARFHNEAAREAAQ
jgi:uncharacterized protein (DUF934 family)